MLSTEAVVIHSFGRAPLAKGSRTWRRLDVGDAREADFASRQDSDHDDDL